MPPPKKKEKEKKQTKGQHSHLQSGSKHSQENSLKNKNKLCMYVLI